jgi:hypothetical protein
MTANELRTRATQYRSFVTGITDRQTVTVLHELADAAAKAMDHGPFGKSGA